MLPGVNSIDFSVFILFILIFLFLEKDNAFYVRTATEKRREEVFQCIK